MKQRIAMVACLPRSKSAWLANYLSHGNAMILHDAFHGLEQIEQFPSELKGFFPKHEVVGNSDPMNTLLWGSIAEWFPDAKWVVVRRPFEEVYASCRKIWDIERAALWVMADRLSELTEALNPMVVDFHKITPHVAMDIAEYLGIDAGGLKRAETLCKMNVQVEPKYLKQSLERFTENPPAWLSRE